METERVRESSPAHEQLSDGCEILALQALGEDVGPLFLGSDPLGNDALVRPDFIAEEVVLESQIFVAKRHAGHIDKGKAALVVLKNRGAN